MTEEVAQQVEVYLRPLCRSLCRHYPVTYEDMLSIGRSVALKLDREALLRPAPYFRPLLRRATINAVINESKRVAARRKHEVLFTDVFSEDDENFMERIVPESPSKDNPAEICDWRNFVSLLSGAERMLVSLIEDVPEMFATMGNSVKAFRGLARREMKSRGYSERVFWEIQKTLKRKLAERTRVRGYSL